MVHKKIIVTRVIQVLTGILFLFSGLLKSFDSQSFAVLISSYGARWAKDLAPVICGVEIVLGLCMILNVRPKITSFFVGALTLIFTIAFAFAYFHKGITDCGCMGSFQFVQVTPAVSFIRNFLVMIGCLWVWLNSPTGAVVVSQWKMWVIYVVGGLAFCLAGYTMCNPLVPKNKIHVGEQINTGLLRYYARNISKGRSVIFIFSPDCGHCWNSTENLKSIKRIPELSNVIGITFANRDFTTYSQEMEPNFEIYNYPTNELQEVISQVPVLLVLNDGKLERKFEFKEIPCGKMLQQMLKGDQ